MTVRDHLRRAATPLRILLAGWIGFVLYAYPGFMTTEAVDELVDARVGTFTDWHSPVMTEVWHILGFFLSGPAPLLAAQGALFLAGAYHLLRRAMPARAAAIAASALLLFPPVLATMAVICPEALLTALLLAGAAAVASARRAVQLTGLGLLLLACGMREGASVAVLPILLIGFAWRADMAAWRRQWIAAGVWLVLVAGASGLGRLVVDLETGRRELALATHDIAGVLRFAGPIPDAKLAAQLDGVPLLVRDHFQQDARYWYARPDDLMYGAHRLFAPPESSDERDRIIAARGHLVRAYPGAYLKYRWRMLARNLGLVRLDPPSPVYTQFTELPSQALDTSFMSRFSVIQRKLVHGMHALERSAMFWAHLYFLVALITLPLAVVRLQRDTAMLLGSAITHELALMFVSARADAHTSHWLITATSLAVILVVARGLTARAARPLRAA